MLESQAGARSYSDLFDIEGLWILFIVMGNAHWRNLKMDVV
jgi:hypothetical protein